MALIDDFKTRFPEFDTAVVDQLFPNLEFVWPCYYGGNLDIPCEKEAALNLLAHLMVGEQANSAAGVRSVASKSVSSVSTSFEATTSTGQSSDFFRSTKYGQRFLQLTSFSIGAHFV
jgi:hypothetical protein